MRNVSLQRFCARTLSIAALALLAGLLPSRAHAQEKGYIICLPGGPGDTEMAKPALQGLSEVLAPLLGKKVLTGTYTTNLATCSRALNDGPLFALVPLSVYLNEGRKAGLVPIAQVVSPEMGGAAPKYHVMVKAAGLSKLEDLAGKKLSMGPVGDERFIRRVMFEGKLPDSLQMVQKKSIVAAVKAVSRGEADAVLVDSIERPRINEIPGGDALREVAATGTLTLPPVITSKAQAARLRPAIVKLCSTARGKESCQELRLEKISSATDSDYARAVKAYGN
jgi:hypothetical protein